MSVWKQRHWFGYVMPLRAASLRKRQQSRLSVQRTDGMAQPRRHTRLWSGSQQNGDPQGLSSSSTRY